MPAMAVKVGILGIDGHQREWLDALVALRQFQQGDVERVPLHCTGCGAGFEVDIDLAACRAPVMKDAATSEAMNKAVAEGASGGPFEAPFEVAYEVNGATRRARLPTGEDQARWQRERAPLRLVADSLMADGSDCGGEAVVQALDQALGVRDPLRALPVQAVCPECGHLAEHRVDLEAHLVTAFAVAQRELLGQVAALAEAYHWSEAEIAAMPPWRRQFYLQRLEAR